MSQIEISCIGSDAVFTNTPNIFSGGNVDTVKFNFNSDWDDFTTKTAVFYVNPKETALQILDSNNVATIPAEMLSKKSKLSVGVIGTNSSDDVKTSKILTYIVGVGSVTNDMETTTPTPDIWLQLLSIVKHNKEIVDNMDLIVDESQIVNKANKDLSNVPFEVIHEKGAITAEIGSYVGTDTCGSANPNTLTFNFVPKLVICLEGSGHEKKICVFIHGAPKAPIHFSGGGSSADVVSLSGWGSNTLSWSASDSYTQFNASKYTYYYIAIG